MWVNKILFQTILEDNRRQQEENARIRESAAATLKSNLELTTQKAKDDSAMDWLRHRVNALEKERAQLLFKAAGIAVPVPEIVPSIPRTMAPANFDHLPSFEDVGDDRAKELGIVHDPQGELIYAK